MNQSMQPAIRRLFQVSSLEAVSREQLEAFVEEYPCFGFGHYLLSRKLKTGNPDEFLQAAQKTSLYFTNPFWLQWMLDNAADPVVREVTAAEPPVHEHAPVHWPEMESPDIPPETAALQADPEAPSSAAELLFESIEKARELRESIEKINEDFHSHNGLPPAASDLPSTDHPIHDEEPPFVLEEPPFVLDEAEQPLEPAPPVMAEAPVAPVAESAAPAPIPEPAPLVAEAPHPPPITDTTPLFEPLHTIDYFASQGIRLAPDENPTDQLGRQLKSFTEWLRIMRRLPQKDREIIPDRATEQNIQNFAAHSIEGKEPVTETMAEVLVKQGMPERARIVYEKLSLLNPDKSAYFAAKIEQLNTH